MSEKILYLNGQYLLENEAKIPLLDRGFLFGDGLYTTIQIRDGIPLFLKHHLKRLEDNCNQFKIAFHSLNFLQEAIEGVIAKNRAHEGIWKMKVLITGGISNAPGLPLRDLGQVAVFLESFTPPVEVPLNLGVFPIPFSCCHAKYKCLAHLNRHFVSEFAKKEGLDDAVTLSEGGILLEASFGNLIFCNETSSEAWIVDPQHSLHYGITISLIEQSLRVEGVVVNYISWKLDQIPIKSVAFRINTMSQIRQIETIGKRKFLLNEKPFQFLKGLLNKLIENELQQKAIF